MTIAVTAASGRLGHAIVHHLAAKPGQDVIAVARDPARVTVPGIAKRAGDYADVASMTAALAGVDTVLIISAPVKGGVDRVPLHRNVIEAARRAGVRWLLFTSVIGNGREEETWFWPTQQVNRQAEADLAASGLAWTVGRNGLYLDLDLVHILAAGRTGAAYANPGGSGRTGYISIDEIARAWAALVADPRHQGRILNITAEPASQAELVAAVNEVFGLAVRYESLTDEENVARFLRLMPERGEVVARMLTGAFQCIRNGAYDVPSDYAAITGRPPKSLREMLLDLREAGAAG